ncbi:MAG: phage antirepressor Ant, partial [Bacteroidota bacterium]
LSNNIQSIGGTQQDYIQIDLSGRKVLFNGDPLPDETLPDILLKARDFAVGLTNENFKLGLSDLGEAKDLHEINHSEVRDLIEKNTGKLPEELSPENDIKQLGEDEK